MFSDFKLGYTEYYVNHIPLINVLLHRVVCEFRGGPFCLQLFALETNSWLCLGVQCFSRKNHMTNMWIMSGAQEWMPWMPWMPWQRKAQLLSWNQISNDLQIFFFARPVLVVLRCSGQTMVCGCAAPWMGCWSAPMPNARPVFIRRSQDLHTDHRGHRSF